MDHPGFGSGNSNIFLSNHCRRIENAACCVNWLDNYKTEIKINLLEHGSRF